MTTVDEVIHRLQRAWNRGDGAGWAAVFAEDAMFVDVLGRIQRGRAVIASEHQKLFDTIYADSQLRIWQLSARQLGTDLLLGHTGSRLAVPAGPRTGETLAAQTLVVQGELVVAFQNTICSELGEFADHDDALAALSPLSWPHT
ncbi:MAG: SgcJ/EcaC family oxidoreductase [Pseudonocardia sp.]|nr:SgcJ/EcaC family oxidoreductase [Pseudonocardia sp.]